jgi:hypothetical protein
MGNALLYCTADPRRLEDREFGEPVAPEAGRRRHHGHDTGEKTDSPSTAFGQSDHDIYFAAVDYIGIVFGAADRGERCCRDPGVRCLCAQRRSFHQIGHQCFEVVALQCRHVIGLGRSEKHPVDASTEQQAQQVAPAKPKYREDDIERHALIREGFFAGIEGPEHIREDDLAIDIARQLLKEGLNDDSFIDLETRLHHSRQAPGPGLCLWSPWLVRLAALAALILRFASGPVGAQTLGPAYSTPPSIAYGELYRDVELAPIFPDSKTFPDMIPDAPPATILDEYRAAKGTPGFDLATFVRKHFTGPTPPGPTVNPAPRGTHLLDYVMRLWPILQQSAIVVPPYSTLQLLPYPYVVPGGRFRGNCSPG